MLLTVKLTCIVISSGSGDEGLSYYAVAVARRDNPSINFFTLQGTVACFPGESGNVFVVFDDNNTYLMH